MAKGDERRELGKRIASARRERQKSQDDLAAAVGVSRGAVGQWETGETAPTTENLIVIARFLHFGFEWLATGRGERALLEPAPKPRAASFRQVPLLSWVSAGKLADATSQIPVEDVPLLAFADLGRGEFFALRVIGDSMDRVSPEGSVIVVNKAERTLINGKSYVFAIRGETTFKLWHASPEYLAPFSTNPSNQPQFWERKRDLETIGRVRRTVLDL